MLYIFIYVKKQLNLKYDFNKKNSHGRLRGVE